MKQKLRLGDSYALTKNKPRYLKIRYFSLVAVLTTMCLYAVKQVSAQQAEPAATAVADIKPLQIGDTIPEWLWHMPLQVVNYPEGKDTITINDYRGKLIILDFWATWCSSCIAMMPKMSALEKDNELGLKVVPVAYEDAEKVSSFLSGNKNARNLSFSSITSDTLLSDLFPHRSLPHYIWINEKGQFVSQTDSEPITEYNLRLISQGGTTQWQEKRDMHPIGPLFLENMPKGTVISGYVLLIKGKIAGLPSGSAKVYQTQKRDRYYSNLSLLEIYKQVLSRAYPNSQLVIDSSAKLLVGNHERFTYHYVAPIGQDYEMDKLALNALNAVSSYNAIRSQSDSTVWVLTKSINK